MTIHKFSQPNHIRWNHQRFEFLTLLVCNSLETRETKRNYIRTKYPTSRKITRIEKRDSRVFVDLRFICINGMCDSSSVPRFYKHLPKISAIWTHCGRIFLRNRSWYIRSIKNIMKNEYKSVTATLTVIVVCQRRVKLHCFPISYRTLSCFWW